MSSMQHRKATAGFASGFMAVTALFGVLAALTTGLGATDTGYIGGSQAEIGVSR